MQHKALISKRFGKAAHQYADHAEIQRQVALNLADHIAQLSLPFQPRILEIGCGTGFLASALQERFNARSIQPQWTLTDLSACMLNVARRKLEGVINARYLVMDGEHPIFAQDSYDLICSSLAMQWFDNLETGLSRLSCLLAPDGYLAIATLACDTFQEWRKAYQDLDLVAATPAYPNNETLSNLLPAWPSQIFTEHLTQTHTSGLDFLKSLKFIGATPTAPGSRPLTASALKNVIARFQSQGCEVTYHIAYGLWQKKTPCTRGIFITGTDTGIGKTLLSSILACAGQADYWKPIQTGIVDEPADSLTVKRLAKLDDQRIHPSLYTLKASLSPWAAAIDENLSLSIENVRLPDTQAPLIVEGAGGLFVPINETCMMIDLAAHLNLPIILVARSTLGTINHTLLSLNALRQQGLKVLGVVLSGPPGGMNGHAIEQFGKVPVLAHIPVLNAVTSKQIQTLAETETFTKIFQMVT